MLEARLQKRLRSLGMCSFGDYCERLFSSPEGDEEIVQMINVVTTNKTDFFREPVHFQYLSDMVLPEFAAGNDAMTGRPFSLWSAGCSSGEEPYTLSMVLSEYAERRAGFRFSILATDISTKVLDTARAGIYDKERVAAVPEPMKQKYIMRSKDRSKGLVRIIPELRGQVRFQRVNLMDENLLLPEPVDVIFCRNVIIYFDRPNQEKLLERLCRSLRPEGYLFLGHSETVHGFTLPLARIASTIYRKTP
jgi:chemotaxis protein methyltransferase CheR